MCFRTGEKREKRERSQLCRPKLLCNTTSKETKNFLFTIPLFLWVNIQMINVMFNLILVVDVKRSKIMSFEFFHFMPEKKKKRVIISCRKKKKKKKTRKICPYLRCPFSHNLLVPCHNNPNQKLVLQRHPNRLCWVLP